MELWAFIYVNAYALDIIAETGLLGGKPVVVPIEQNHYLVVSTSPLVTHPERYRRSVGQLIYLTITRPN